MGKVERLLECIVSTHPLFFKMNTFAEQILFPHDYYIPRTSPLDWMEMEWSGCADDEDDFAHEVCTNNCSLCAVAAARVWRAIQGPVNRDCIPLGYLLVAE